MNYTIEQVASTLKATREEKSLTQRDLSTRSGVPQSHISKIERGAVDLRVSSLVALARVLDLELTLVPRQALPAVQSIVRTSSRNNVQAGEAARRAQGEPVRDAESARPAYSLDEDVHD